MSPTLEFLTFAFMFVFRAAVPLLVLATKRGRENPQVLFASSILVVLGVVLNRPTFMGMSTYLSTSPRGGLFPE